MQPPSARVAAMPRSGIRVILDLAQRPGVIHLEIGQPDFPTPAHLIEAAFRAASEGYTRYTPNAGLMSLREAVAEKVRRENGIQATPENIVITMGGMGGIFGSLAAVLNAGDEVLVPDPGYPNYTMAAMLCDARAVPYALYPSEDHQPDPERLEALVTPRTRVIMLNSPSNPIGSVLRRKSLEGVLRLAERRDLYVISDECYEKIIYEGEHVSIAALDPEGRVFTLFSFSKTYAMTGWRVGFVVAPEGFSLQLVKLQEATVACAPSISQKAAEAALAGPQDCAREMVAVYRRRRDLAMEILHPTGRCRYTPAGAFYALIDITGYGGDSYAFAKELLAECDVAVAPGETFGSESAAMIRISTAVDDATLAEGLRRLAGFMQRKCG